MGAKRVLIMAGGTGGHVFPALAVAEELLSRDMEISWLGTRRGIEARLVPARDIPIYYIGVAGLRGTGLARKLRAPFDLLRAVLQSLAVLWRVKPQAVLGLGGFASGPGGVAAWLLRKPLVIHEQNAVAGTTNRLLSKLARRRLEGFPGSLRNAEFTGNPVRADISGLPKPSGLRQSERETTGGEGEKRRHLLILGGSLGALAINQVLPEALAKMPETMRPRVVHQTGAGHLEVTLEAYEEAGVRADAVTFIEDMAGAYAWADLVVCRAGALTVAELTAAGVASVLVPYPHAVDDHQAVNAGWLSDQGAAVVMRQDALDANGLAALLETLLSDDERLAAMADAAYQLRTPDATRRVADVCEEVMA